MEPPLPLKSVVLFIACGAMVFIIVFIFAKRQITRFALKSRGIHQSIAAEAPKALRLEIERKLHRVMEIKSEPQLLPPEFESSLLNTGLKPDECEFYLRMKAIDSLALLDDELRGCNPPKQRSVATIALRPFLLGLRPGGPLEGCNIEVIEKFTEAYDMARHDHEHFGRTQYNEYMDLLKQLIEVVRVYINQHNPKGSTEGFDDEENFEEESTSDRQPMKIKTTHRSEESEKQEGGVTYRTSKGVPGVLRMRPTNTGGSSQLGQGSSSCMVSDRSSAASTKNGDEETSV